MAFPSRRCWPPSCSESAWLERGGGCFNFQISEFVKLVIILLVARYLSELKSNEISARDLFKLGGLVGIPTALVVAQPDFSTGATYVPILIVGILLAGVQWRHVVADRARMRVGGALRAQGLSEGAVGHLPGSLARSAGPRISGDSVQDRGGRRRHVGTEA